MKQRIGDSWVEWATASKNATGEIVCGDAYLVQAVGSSVLAAVIDGAGHGEEANLAALAAIEVLASQPQESPTKLLTLCHERLHGNRGAAISVASLNCADGMLTWAGVGNVEGVIMGSEQRPGPKRESLLLRNGVIGFEFTPPRISTLPFYPGDTLMFATDGIKSIFWDEVEIVGQSPQTVADAVLSRHGKGIDDALVLVLRLAE